MNSFETLNAINVNEHVEKKNGLSYLSWAWAWAEAKKRYPDASYTVESFNNSLPYLYDEGVGAMVWTSVTINGLTHRMWLPVMDNNNRAMKKEPYVVVTRYGKEIQVDAFTMFDVNKTIMRCLVKNLAMFGLGLYIYAGEDLPDAVEESKQEAKEEPKKEEKVQVQKSIGKPATPNQVEILKKYKEKNKALLIKIAQECNADLNNLTIQSASKIIARGKQYSKEQWEESYE